MKKLLPILLLLALLLPGCSSSASTSAINAAYQNGYEEGQADLDGYIPEDDAIDYVFEYFRDEAEERALDNMIGNDLDALLDEVITDENWDSVAEYLEKNRLDEITAITKTSQSTTSSPVTEYPSSDEAEDPFVDEQEQQPEEFPDDDSVYVQLYVLNTNSKKFHYQSCPSASKMNQENRQERETTRDQLIAEGYSPCGNCNP